MVGVKVKTPFAPVVAVPIAVLPSYIVTMEPISAVPVSVGVLSVVVAVPALSVGASGGVVSVVTTSSIAKRCRYSHQARRGHRRGPR